MTKNKFIVIFFFLISNFLFAQEYNYEHFTVLQHDLIKVDSIQIIGNNSTKDFVILRELTFKEGDYVSGDILDYNKERVFSLGLFNDVKISCENDITYNKIIISVLESWYIYPIPFIKRYIGDASKTTYGLNLLYENFRGRNELLRTVISCGYDPALTILYNIPVLFDKEQLGIGLIVSFSNLSNKTMEGIQLNGSDYLYKVSLAKVNLNYRINQFNLLVGTVGYEYYEAPNKNFQSITASNGKVDRIISTGLEYFYDSRNLKQYAEEGIYFDLSYTYKGFGINNISYNIIDGDLRGYKKILGNLVWKGRIKTRSAFGEQIPLYDYSLLGYIEYIRGYSLNVLDGKTYLLSSVELSYPIIKEWDIHLRLPFLPESLTSGRIGIAFNIFADAGSAFDNYSDFSYSNFMIGWGIGLNFLILPFDDVRIEYAFNNRMKGEILLATGFSF